MPWHTHLSRLQLHQPGAPEQTSISPIVASDTPVGQMTEAHLEFIGDRRSRQKCARDRHRPTAGHWVLWNFVSTTASTPATWELSGQYSSTFTACTRLFLNMEATQVLAHLDKSLRLGMSQHSSLPYTSTKELSASTAKRPRQQMRSSRRGRERTRSC